MSGPANENPKSQIIIRDFLLIFDESLTFEPEFQFRFTGDLLRVPIEFKNTANNFGIRGATMLIALAKAFPSSLAKSLSWSNQKLLQEIEKISEEYEKLARPNSLFSKEL